MKRNHKPPRLTLQSLRVLRLVAMQPMAGADIVQATGIATGTVYPLLYRFERCGYLVSELEDGSPQALGRPLRRVYAMTPTGLLEIRRVLRELRQP